MEEEESKSVLGISEDIRRKEKRKKLSWGHFCHFIIFYGEDLIIRNMKNFYNLLKNSKTFMKMSQNEDSHFI